MKINRLFVILLVTLSVGVILLCISFTGCSDFKFNNLFDSNNMDDTTDSNDNDIVVDNNYVNNGILLNSSLIDSSLYESYGISSSVLSAYLFTATVSNSAVYDLSWSVAWQNPESDFAKTNDVNDFLTITKYNNWLNIILSCTSGFSEKITLSVKSTSNPNYNASAVLEFTETISDVRVNIGNISLNLGGETPIKYLATHGINGDGGCVTVTYDASENYTISEDFKVNVKFIGGDVDRYLRLKGLVVSLGRNLPFSSDNALGNEIYFDYDHDISNWLIARRAGDIVFSQLSETDLYSYLSDYSSPNNVLANVVITITGNTTKYVYESTLVYDGYRTA